MLAAYLLIVGAGLRIAARAEHAFDKLLAIGLTTLIGVQAFIIIGGVIRVLPLTGVTLPFIVLRRLVAGRRATSSWPCCCGSPTRTTGAPSAPSRWRWRRA